MRPPYVDHAKRFVSPLRVAAFLHFFNHFWSVYPSLPKNLLQAFWLVHVTLSSFATCGCGDVVHWRIGIEMWWWVARPEMHVLIIPDFQYRITAKETFFSLNQTAAH